MKLALRNLEVYMGAYDNKSNVSFLSDNLNENCELIKNMVSDFPSTAIITHTTKQYLQTAECLVKSLLKFSEHKVILYTQNCEADFDYPNLIKIPFETDFDSGRNELYKLLDKGNTAIDGILNLAKEGEHPRAYEVAGQLIKTQSEIAQNLLDLQDKLKKIKDVKGETPKNVTNALFVGSTTELQKLIKKNKDKK